MDPLTKNNFEVAKNYNISYFLKAIILLCSSDIHHHTSKSK